MGPNQEEIPTVASIRERLSADRVTEIRTGPTERHALAVQIATHPPQGVPALLPGFAEMSTYPVVTDEKGREKMDFDRIKKIYEENGYAAVESATPTGNQLDAFVSMLHEQLMPERVAQLSEDQWALAATEKDGDKYEGKDALVTQWKKRGADVRAGLTGLYQNGEIPSVVLDFLDKSELEAERFAGEDIDKTDPVLAHGNADIKQTVFKEDATTGKVEMALWNMRHAVLTPHDLGFIADFGNAWGRIVQSNYQVDGLDWGGNPPPGGELDAASYFLYRALSSPKVPIEKRERYRQLLKYAVAFSGTSLTTYHLNDKALTDPKKVEEGKRWLERGAAGLDFIDRILPSPTQDQPL